MSPPRARALLACLLLSPLTACPKRSTRSTPDASEPTSVTTVGTNLHVQGVPGVATVNIQTRPDGGEQLIQIGGARAVLPGERAHGDPGTE